MASKTLIDTAASDSGLRDSSKDEELALPHDNTIKSADNKTPHVSTADEALEVALGTIDQEFTIDSDNSPFPEVRANVPNVDDVDLPVNTVRMWFLGVIFTMVSCGLPVYQKNCKIAY